jgi:hypothetical protein
MTSSFGNNMGARIFQLSDGVEGSTNVKVDGLIWYVRTSEPIYWELGSLGSDNTLVVIDMEFGHIFTWYGVLGMWWYFKMIISLASSNKDTFRALSRGVQIVVILTAFSSSTILNMSVFPFVCLIAYSKIIEVIGGRNHAKDIVCLSNDDDGWEHYQSALYTQ